MKWQEIWLLSEDYYYYYIITLLRLRVTARPLSGTTSPLSHYFPLVRVLSVPYSTQRCAAGSVTSSAPVNFFICSCCRRWIPRCGCLERPLPSGTHGEESRPPLVAGDEAAATNKEKTERCWQTPLLWCAAPQFICRGKERQRVRAKAQNVEALSGKNIGFRRNVIFNMKAFGNHK